MFHPKRSSPKNYSKRYVRGISGSVEFDKKFGDLSFLENEDFGYGSEGAELLVNECIGELEDDSLVHTYQNNFRRLISIGFSVTKTTVGCTVAHVKIFNQLQLLILSIYLDKSMHHILLIQIRTKFLIKYLSSL